jgi:diguanylate cyclase (GGDEF)-like protein
MNSPARPTILIVDDDITCREVLTQVLSDEYQTVAKDCGADAIIAVNSLEIDIVLLDLQMPEMDGEAVLALIRENCIQKGIPVFFITATTDVETEVRMLSLGAADYITKPINSALVKGRIKVHLELALRTKELKAAVEELHLLARFDPLTGLGNRRHFYEAFDNERARSLRYSYPLSFIVFDIDHFKLVNDTFGHQAGDDVLIEFAKQAIEFTRESDVFVRLGGEEFACMMPQTPLSHAREVADRFRQRIASTEFDIGNSQPIKITVSCGVSELLVGDADIDSAISRADKALYSAKDNGRNCVFVFGQ